MQMARKASTLPIRKQPSLYGALSISRHFLIIMASVSPTVPVTMSASMTSFVLVWLTIISFGSAIPGSMTVVVPISPWLVDHYFVSPVQIIISVGRWKMSRKYPIAP